MRSVVLIMILAPLLILPLALRAESPQQNSSCAIDLMLAIDGSGSITPENFDAVRSFTRQLVGSFVIGPNDANVGILQFSNTPELYIALSENSDDVNRAIDNMTQFGDRTDIAGAIELAQEQFITRRGIPRVIIILTDGLHNMGGNPIASADRARLTGTTIFGIAVGSFDVSELTAISGGEQNVFTVNSFANLTLILDSLLSSACSVSQTAPPTPVVAAPTTLPPVPQATTPPQPTQVGSASTPASGPPTETQIVFASDRDGDFEIFSMSPTGGNLLQLTFNNAQDDYPTLSTDGRRIAWESEQDGGGTSNIWAMNADGSNPQKLTDNSSNDYGPSWSPDGSQIAFYSDRNGQNTAIWLMNADGSNPRQLSATVADAVDRSPSWSSDGLSLAYHSDRSGGREIYVIDVNSGAETRLSDNGVYDGQVDWAFDGQTLAFATTRSMSGDAADLYIMGRDGSNPTQITDDPATDDDPSWAPNAMEIAFESGRDGDYDIWIINADGSNPRQLTDHPGMDKAPDWGWKLAQNITAAQPSTPVAPATAVPTPLPPAPPGPRDTQIAFASDRDGDYDIYSMDGEGNNLRQLTINDTDDDDPSWSSDGRLLAWASEGDGETYDIWIMNADGSDPRQLTTDPAEDRAPTWSPDGTRLAFQSDREGDEDIYILDMTSGDIEPLIQNDGADDMSPTWSPDGGRLAYYSDKSGGREVYVVDLNTGGELRLTTNGVYDGEPNWSRASDQLVFGSTRSMSGDDPDLFVINADGSGDPLQITDEFGTDDDPSWSPDGNQVVFVSGRDGNFDIFIIDADGTSLLQLTNDPAQDISPDWMWKP